MVGGRWGEIRWLVGDWVRSGGRLETKLDQVVGERLGEIRW